MATKNKAAVNRKLSDLLEYKEEFELAMMEEAKTLPERKSFSDKNSRNDPRNDVIVCVRIQPIKEENTKMRNVLGEVIES